MRKILTVVLMFTIGFSIVGCSCKKDETIMLEDSQYVSGEGNIEFLATFNPIQEMMDSKTNFVFYMYGATCSGCHKFTPILTNYVKEKGINMYAVEVNDVALVNKEIKQTLGCTPAVAIFKEGTIYQYIDACEQGQAEYFLSKEGFASWFETYVEFK